MIGLLVGASRIYLMVHYATDIIAGIILAIIAGLAGYGISCAICNGISKKKGKACQLSKKESLPAAGKLALIFGWMVAFAVSFAIVNSSGGSDAVRCAYNEEYDCQNEAEVGSSKYPAIDGEYYCKIHWKEKMGR